MKKNIFFALLLCAFGTSVFAQQKKNVYWLTNKGKVVENLDSADFIRIITEPDSGSRLYNFYEYFKNDTRKTVGKLRSFDLRLIYDGLLLEFYESGGRKSIKRYENEELNGDAYFYHENGKIATHWIYSQSNDKSDYMIGKGSIFMGVAKLMMKQDSLGNVTIKDGNGYDVLRDEYEKDTLVAKGNYKNGFKDGEWKGVYTVDKESFYIEHYADGKLISGENTYNGIKYLYDNLEGPPAFKRGQDGWALYLANNISYPRDAQERRIQGRVILSFIVGKDGTVEDVQVQKSVYPSIDKEAVRVLKNSPKWTPGKQRGVPVRVKYQMPIGFKL